MSWLKVTFKISKEYLEDWEFALIDQGALSVSLENNETESIFEPNAGETPLWSSIKISALFNAKTSPEDLLKKFNANLTYHGFNSELIEDKNWLDEYTKYFKPQTFNNRICVCPSWITPPDSRLANLIINPGLAFGTGGHPSTSLCLESLSEKFLESKFVVDFGCGSGILALASLKLNACKALAVDTDPQALRASKENAALNELSKDIEIAMPDQREIANWKGKADIVIANILSNPLINLAPKLTNFLKNKGVLILSGILENQVDEVVAHYGKYLPMKQKQIKEGWAILEGILQ